MPNATGSQASLHAPLSPPLVDNWPPLGCGWAAIRCASHRHWQHWAPVNSRRTGKQVQISCAKWIRPIKASILLSCAPDINPVAYQRQQTRPFFALFPPVVAWLSLSFWIASWKMNHDLFIGQNGSAVGWVRHKNSRSCGTSARIESISSVWHPWRLLFSIITVIIRIFFSTTLPLIAVNPLPLAEGEAKGGKFTAAAVVDWFRFKKLFTSHVLDSKRQLEGTHPDYRRVYVTEEEFRNPPRAGIHRKVGSRWRAGSRWFYKRTSYFFWVGGAINIAVIK